MWQSDFAKYVEKRELKDGKKSLSSLPRESFLIETDVSNRIFGCENFLVHNKVALKDKLYMIPIFESLKFNFPISAHYILLFSVILIEMCSISYWLIYTAVNLKFHTSIDV